MRVLKRTIPKVLSCPVCGSASLRVTKSEGFNYKVSCGSCGITDVRNYNQSKEFIDVYNDFVDAYLSHKTGN
jgi:transcription elongation factor Elf1